nr:unnamed protein product [Callosobruchus analis]
MQYTIKTSMNMKLTASYRRTILLNSYRSHQKVLT